MTPRSGVAAAATALALFLTGCSSSGDALSDGPDSPEGTSESPATSEAPTEAPSETPSGSPDESPAEVETTTGVAPATGKVIKVENLRVNAPQGWFVSDPLGMQQAASPPELGTMLTVFRFPNSELFTIDELADEEVSDMGKGGKRLDDVELDGQQVYHLTGQPSPGEHAERFGTIVNDERVSIDFGFANGESKAVRKKIIQSVLVTARIGS